MLGNSSLGASDGIAASNPSGRWKSVPIEIEAGGSASQVRTAPRKARLGKALGLIAKSQSFLFDLSNSLEVELIDKEQWLESCDDEALVHGANLAIAGSEVIQFGTVEPLGAGRFRLSRLLRGRRGTEWAMGKHVAGEPFAMVELDMLSRVDLGASMQGATVKARPVGICDAEADFVLIAVGGEALRPPCPVHLQATRTGVGDLLVSWVPRSRCGWQWVDEIESPPGESRERYRATLECNGARIEVETDVPSAMFEASALANLGAGYATLSVQQLGDLAASHAAKLDIILN